MKTLSVATIIFFIFKSNFTWDLTFCVFTRTDKYLHTWGKPLCLHRSALFKRCLIIDGECTETRVFCRKRPKGCQSNPIAIFRSIAPHDATLPGEIKSDWSSLPDSFLFFFPFLGHYFAHTNDAHSLSLQVARKEATTCRSEGWFSS